MNTLEKCYSSLNVPVDPNDTDRTHRIGISYTDNHSRKKVHKIDHGKFAKFYKSRLSYHTDGSKEPSFSVSVDITKRRYLLLSKAKGLIKCNTNISYVYSDINCSLALKFKYNSFKYFNSEIELHHLLND